MASKKPSIPKGTRDFSSTEIRKRQYIINIISQYFRRHGFEPIETPSFENTETLMGNYGEEGDRLIFRILNSGDYLSKVPPEDLTISNYQRLTRQLSDRALRYDLTVPFSRYVATHQHELVFPFKRYQIQPVWRADRPQKGRYREFYQCDADVIGSDSLWLEVDLIALYHQVFNALKLPIQIKVNNRKILTGIAEELGIENQLDHFTIALDKIDKIGIAGVLSEMKQRGISSQATDRLSPLLAQNGNNDQMLSYLKDYLKNSPIAKDGISELEFLLQKIDMLDIPKSSLEIDITLARGLHYYTGCIFEVKAKEIQLGSIGGGGRYDHLAANFGLKQMSGVGISFGLDRIYLAMEEQSLFPKNIITNNRVLFINFGKVEATTAYQFIQQLQKNDIIAELYPDPEKTGKQMTYADKKNYRYVVLIGTNEITTACAVIKDMQQGIQEECPFTGLVDYFSKLSIKNDC